MSSTLFRRDFSLMIVGQIISLLGNAVVRFVLSLYILDVTGSAAVFGGILALSMAPMAVFSPAGGVLADRFPRQRIMYLLDFATAALVIFFALDFFPGAGPAAVGSLMVLLCAIQALYQPAVMASLPALAPPDRLAQANGVAAQVHALASLLGPILAGMLYAVTGVRSLLLASGACFFASAVLELFLRIPFTPPPGGDTPLRQAGADLRDAYVFLRRERPHLFALLGVVAGINLFLSSLYMVGLPYLVKVWLGLSARLYSYAEAAMGLGSIAGGLLSGLLAGMTLYRSCRFLILAALSLAPMALAAMLPAHPLAVYGVLVASVLAGMACATLFSVAAQTYLQQQTPPALLGKVASFVSAICVCAMPLGQAIYGFLFQALHSHIWMVLLLGGGASLLLALRCRAILRRTAP